MVWSAFDASISFVDKQTSLLCFLHEEADVVLLFLQDLLQSINFLLIIQEFPLKTMVCLLQSFTKSLKSQQQSVILVLCLWVNVSVKSLPYFPPDCQTDLVGRPNTGSVWRPHYRANRSKTPNQTGSSLEFVEFRLLISTTQTSWWLPCETLSFVETSAAHSASPLETPHYSCLWTSAWEAEPD